MLDGELRVRRHRKLTPVFSQYRRPVGTEN